EALGINDRQQLAGAGAVLRERIATERMSAGVTIIDPQNTYIDAGVTVGRDTTLWPGTLLRGATSVGANCQIGPHTTLIDTVAGDGACVRHALVERAELPPGATVGPCAHVIGE
ncbi:hypothetical protein SE17_29410, partial [Kouleothrix aurantiaca]